MQQIVKGRGFALAELALVSACGIGCMFQPSLGGWLVLLAMLPWGIRLAAGLPAFRRTPLDGLIAVFALTAWAGYWAAYDRPAAWAKVWLILAAALLYYAIASQPRENLDLVCWACFGIGAGVSLYFFLTYDFAAAPRKLEMVNRIGRWLMEVRPETGWTPIHPNYTAGLAAVTAPLVFYLLFGKRDRKPGLLPLVLGALGLCLTAAALLMTTSRGAFMAIASAAGLWLVWRLAGVFGDRARYFPAFVLVYICAVTALLYLGPAGWNGGVAEHYQFGNGSRAELFSRSLYLLGDTPFTGGGLGSFPGLYSRYILSIPYYNVPNSHNLFMDAGIEQGIPGGLAYLFAFIGAIWFLARSISRSRGTGDNMFGWVVMLALVMAFVHGMVDDYLYNGRGTFLCLLPVALATLTSSIVESEDASNRAGFRFNRKAAGILILAVALLFIILPGKILSMWYADVGSVRMARVELERFPNGGWPGPEITERMSQAEAALNASVQLDPSNRTANQRLGLIALLRQDLPTATRFLEAAHRQAPAHRGIIKALGFCYIWTGDLPAAKALLQEIPETPEELDAYISWWKEMGREDLSAGAASALLSFKDTVQP